MKVCFVCDNLNKKTGWGRMSAAISEGLSDKGFKVQYILKSEMDLGFFNIFKIRKFIKECDIIHAIDIFPFGVVASLANIGLNKPIVLHALGTYSVASKRRPLKNLLMQWAVNRAKKIFIVSEFTKKQIAVSGLKLKNTEVLPVGIDLNFSKDYSHLKNKMDFPFILNVAEIKERKGIIETIKAFSLFNNKNPKVKLVIVGKRPKDYYANSVDMLIEKRGLKDSIIFMEKISDEELLSLYKYCEFFCMLPVSKPDSFEGFGLVYFEASVMNKTSIGAVDSGAEAAIVHNKTGLLVNLQNSQECAKAMELLFKNKELRIKLAQNAKKYAQEFSWKKVVNRIAEVYETF